LPRSIGTDAGHRPFQRDEDLAADYRGGWSEAPPLPSYTTPYRVGWEKFLRHVAADTPMQSDFAAGIRDVAFAEACHRSMRERTWIAFPPASPRSS
jgi:predicted dehydrogenase